MLAMTEEAERRTERETGQWFESNRSDQIYNDIKAYVTSKIGKP